MLIEKGMEMSNFAGFDIDIYPGAEIMQAIKSATNMAWTAYYLAPAPARENASWMGARAALAVQGWGLAPVFLGQQADCWKPDSFPQAHKLTAAQGLADAASACNLALREGFVEGSYIYLDWEDGSALGADALTYLDAYTRGIVTGRYSAGFYCSHLVAPQIRQMVQKIDSSLQARLWVFKIDSDTGQRYSGDLVNFPTTDLDPAYSLIWAWQFTQDRTGVFAGIHDQVDLDIASVADPGAAAVA